MTVPHWWVAACGYSAATATAVSLAPQVWRVWRRRSAHDISAGTLALLAAGGLLWLLYGMALGSRPMIVANSITLALALLTLALKIRFAPHDVKPGGK
jgi:MtN3 and saliva related transmembrane protein